MRLLVRPARVAFLPRLQSHLHTPTCPHSMQLCHDLLILLHPEAPDILPSLVPALFCQFHAQGISSADCCADFCPIASIFLCLVAPTLNLKISSTPTTIHQQHYNYEQHVITATTALTSLARSVAQRGFASCSAIMRIKNSLLWSRSLVNVMVMMCCCQAPPPPWQKMRRGEYYGEDREASDEDNEHSHCHCHRHQRTYLHGVLNF